MSTQQGRGGTGSHKHGVSGHSGHPSGFKQQLAREANREEEEKKKRKPKNHMFSSVSEVFRNFKPR